MDAYQAKASGAKIETEEAESGGAHKLGKVTAVYLILASLVLDIVSIADVLALDVPIADILATIFTATIFILLVAKGIPSMRPMLRWIVMYAAEWIPFVDWLPLYTVGAVLIVIMDHSKIGSTIIEYVPSKGSAGSKISGRVGQRLQKFEEMENRVRQRAERLREKLPGPLRNLPQKSGAPSAAGGSARNFAASAPADLPQGDQRQKSPLDENPFPGTYENFEKQLLPDLESIENIDVSGERQLASKPPTPQQR